MNSIVFGLTWGMLFLAICFQVTPNNTIKLRDFDIWNLLMQPGVFALYVYYAAYHIFKGRVKLRGNESVACSWILHNGGVIHLGMEGFGGLLNLWEQVEHPYRIIDNRFNGGPDSGSALTVHIITVLELCVWMPLCFMSAVAFTKKSKHRYLLAIVLSVCQIVGTVFFVVPPMVNSCIELPPFNVPGCFPPLNMFNLLYVYIAFGSNFCWFVVPFVVLAWAWKKELENELKLKIK